MRLLFVLMGKIRRILCAVLASLRMCWDRYQPIGRIGDVLRYGRAVSLNNIIQWNILPDILEHFDEIKRMCDEESQCTAGYKLPLIRCVFHTPTQFVCTINRGGVCVIMGFKDLECVRALQCAVEEKMTRMHRQFSPLQESEHTFL